MFSSQRSLLAILAIFFLVFAPQTSLAQKRPHRRMKPSPVPQMTEPVKPPEPTALAQLPPSPPQVSYSDGNLLIEARNSTLGDVLNAVRRQTGLPIEISSGDTSERVVGRIGPGPTRSVLADLLNGSHFNYAMLSSPGAPDQVTRVMLTPRGSSPSAANQQTATVLPQQPLYQQQPQQAFQSNQAAVQPPGAAEGDGEAAEENGENAEAEEQADTEPQQPQPPQQDQVQPQGANPGEVKTPEQLLQQLQQQQQQFLQRRGNPNGAPQTQPPPPQ